MGSAYSPSELFHHPAQAALPIKVSFCSVDIDVGGSAGIDKLPSAVPETFNNLLRDNIVARYCGALARSDYGARRIDLIKRGIRHGSSHLVPASFADGAEVIPRSHARIDKFNLTVNSPKIVVQRNSFDESTLYDDVGSELAFSDLVRRRGSFISRNCGFFRPVSSQPSKICSSTQGNEADPRGEHHPPGPARHILLRYKVLFSPVFLSVGLLICLIGLQLRAKRPNLLGFLVLLTSFWVSGAGFAVITL